MGSLLCFVTPVICGSREGRCNVRPGTVVRQVYHVAYCLGTTRMPVLHDKFCASLFDPRVDSLVADIPQGVAEEQLEP